MGAVGAGIGEVFSKIAARSSSKLSPLARKAQNWLDNEVRQQLMQHTDVRERLLSALPVPVHADGTRVMAAVRKLEHAKEALRRGLTRRTAAEQHVRQLASQQRSTTATAHALSLVIGAENSASAVAAARLAAMRFSTMQASAMALVEVTAAVRAANYELGVRCDGVSPAVSNTTSMGSIAEGLLLGLHSCEASARERTGTPKQQRHAEPVWSVARPESGWSAWPCVGTGLRVHPHAPTAGTDRHVAMQRFGVVLHARTAPDTTEVPLYVRHEGDMEVVNKSGAVLRYNAQPVNFAPRATVLPDRGARGGWSSGPVNLDADVSGRMSATGTGGSHIERSPFASWTLTPGEHVSADATGQEPSMCDMLERLGVESVELVADVTYLPADKDE